MGKGEGGEEDRLALWQTVSNDSPGHVPFQPITDSPDKTGESENRKRSGSTGSLQNERNR